MTRGREPEAVLVYRAFRARDCEERALVLTAMSIEHEVVPALVGWRLVVSPVLADRAREQLRLYEIENRPRAFAEAADAVRPGALAGAVAYVSVLLLVFTLQTGYAFGIDWASLGRVQVAAMRGGEWWRAVTALTLHADAAHLAANLGFGAFFGVLLARAIGGGFAWLMILLAGAAGNLMNSFVQPPTHAALGASTAVFAALGLLAAYLWSGRQLIRDSWARRWAPVVGGIWFLAWLGTGDERTDIVAHLTGFVAGFGLGLVLGRWLTTRSPELASQRWCAFLALGVLAGCWWLAL